MQSLRHGALALLLTWPLGLPASVAEEAAAPPQVLAPSPARWVAPADDDAFLDLLERDAFRYFWNEAFPSGLVKDRSATLGGDQHAVASVAATGFGLAALAVGAERGWVTREAAAARCVTTLRTLLERCYRHHGFWYHFLNPDGSRAWSCEVSTIDSGWLAAGALVAGSYFGGDVAKLADELLGSIEWPAAVVGDAPILSHGWKPDEGWLPYRWDSFSEHLVMNLLALGSPTHPLPAAAWTAWSRGNQGELEGLPTFTGGLFFHGYCGGSFVDWRRTGPDVLGGGYDYWQVGRHAVLGQQRWCLAQAATEAWRGAYDERFFGLSATDTPDGSYHAYAAPPGTPVHDGTINLNALAGCLPFAPEVVLPVLRRCYEEYGSRIYGRFGFSNAVNRARDFVHPDAIGIDLGSALLAIENHRSGLVWKLFHQHPAVQAGLRQAGLKP